MPAAPTRYGLRLTLGGAPATPHTVVHPDTGSWIPGEYHPLVATPVPFDGMPLAAAQKLAADDRVPLELVEIDPDPKKD